MCFLMCSSVLIITLKNIYFESQTKKIEKNLDTIIEEKKMDSLKKQNHKFEEGIIGILIIPKLEIKAVIKEGTNKEVLKHAIRTL
ncbi:MAG: hypothetical protein HFJ51_00740 [Clostridia bacterium]|nr:hypothetical protein [Clostridia bacterium]